MKQQSLQHIKGQLTLIKKSDSSDYTKGLIDGLLAYLDTEYPKEITLKIRDVKTNNLINAVKHIRMYLNLGLADAKNLVDGRGYLYKGNDIDVAMKLKTRLEDYLELELDGPETIKLLYKQE